MTASRVYGTAGLLLLAMLLVVLLIDDIRRGG